jgi:hypothetical protein
MTAWFENLAWLGKVEIYGFIIITAIAVLYVIGEVVRCFENVGCIRYELEQIRRQLEGRKRNYDDLPP